MARGYGEGPEIARSATRLLGIPVIPRGRLNDFAFRELIMLARQYPENKWSTDDHISQARNAHYTNTYQEMSQALRSNANFLEGDVRFRSHEAIMAHDKEAFSMTLREWLRIANISGRGIKLDIKDALAIDPVLQEIKGIDDRKLVINVMTGNWDKEENATPAQIANIRQAAPQAIINISVGDIPYSTHTLTPAIECAQASGDREKTMFPLQVEYITPSAIKKLAPYGMIGAWNLPVLYNPKDIPAVTQRLREEGVDGMIDLRHVPHRPSFFPFALPHPLAGWALHLAEELENLRRHGL